MKFRTLITARSALEKQENESESPITTHSKAHIVLTMDSFNI